MSDPQTIKTFKFSGGEIQAELDVSPHVKLIHRIQSSDDFMTLLMVSEIINRMRPISKSIVIPYFPYARQDRVTKENVAFSLRVAAKLINGLAFDEIISCDVHSDVAPALVDRMRVISQLDIITKHFSALDAFIRSDITAIIAPDAGASKKAGSIASAYKLPMFQASKIRNTTTGEITGTKVHDDMRGYECLIVDDICDGGRTFIELAKVLRDGGASKVYLYVTHGIFSKGFDVFDGLIDRIFTTDAFISPFKNGHDRVQVTINPLKYMEM